ncbi:LCP family protein [Patescibacteria group bacterium]|nr:LCP family protein [Patescibacteria group bacterium]
MNYSLGPENMDMGRFWDDIADIDTLWQNNALTRLFKYLGQQPHIATDLISRLENAYTQRDPELTGHYLDMAYVLGLEKNHGIKPLLNFLETELNPPSRLERVLATGLTYVVTGATCVALAYPGLMVIIENCNQCLPPTFPTPIVRAAGQDMQPQALPTTTPRPAETPTSTPTPEIRVEPRDLFQKDIAPEIYQKVLQIREQETRSDPDYLQRINPELNKDRINFLILGGRENNALTDTILMVSYHLPSNTVSLVSLPRDLQSPEVLNNTHDVRNSRINQAFSQGGFDLTKLAVENATGLSADLTMKVDFDLLVDLIDNTVGTIEVDLEKPINDPTYPALEDSGYDPFYIPAGTHQLDGATALKVARSRHGSSDYDRAERQRKIVIAFVKKVLEETKSDPIKGAQTLYTIYNLLQQKIGEGTLQPDFDIGILLLPDFSKLIQNTPGMLWSQAFGDGWRIADPPSSFSIGINNGNFVVGAGIPDIAITKIRNGNPSGSNPSQWREEYWQPVRNLVQKSLTANSNF